eukprot:CAMPEP_0198285552 /NCGR_PEP_ID=MMETSP1449-20131203/4809_1 /TAXON_ID=420275 /ORGANISM="Attheya septentrionalis, Strain CCMP2084" /LENGTH=155 /DNA_ID=CAMNT_0043983005 /DNA_START=925 /DNA_END=1392 /DNA_ORIENTATION=-
MSHINQLLNSFTPRVNNWRILLVQWNYMTWALSAFSEKVKGHSPLFASEERHLKVAMTRLMEMDYIIDLKHEDNKCREYLLSRVMKINNPIGHANSHEASGYVKDFTEHKLFIEANNALDIELYDFASMLIALDCQFIRMMFGSEVDESVYVDAQ